MASPNGSYLNIGRRLTLTLAVLIAVILGGNGLVILQFETARRQTDRLTGVSQQLIAVLRLQDSLLMFHQELNQITRSKDAARLTAEAGPMRTTLLQETRETRSTLAYVPPEYRVDPAFLTALDTIEITLPSQLQDIASLARAGDWEAVHLRLENELMRIEATTAAHVKSLNQDLDEELPRAVANMKEVQRRIIVVVPATAIATVLIATFFGSSIARRLLELRLEERVSERTRIARELHDTLLQSFQGLLLRLRAVSFNLLDRPEVQKTLEGIIDQARQAVVEGRDAVQGLRASAAITNNLAIAISAFGAELTAESGAGSYPRLTVKAEGTPRDLAPLVQDEIHRIACELVRNAFRHAEARLVEVKIHYEERQLRLSVRDNGKGIAPDVLAAGGRPGHYGLTGMQERARVAGCKLALASKPGSGTEADLTVPAALAYAKSSTGRWPIPSGGEREGG